MIHSKINKVELLSSVLFALGNDETGFFDKDAILLGDNVCLFSLMMWVPAVSWCFQCKWIIWSISFCDILFPDLWVAWLI